MATYKLFNRSQSVQVLGSADSMSAAVFATIVNSPKGWIARRDPSDGGVNVQHMVNQPNAADLIASALGL